MQNLKQKTQTLNEKVKINLKNLTSQVTINAPLAIDLKGIRKTHNIHERPKTIRLPHHNRLTIKGKSITQNNHI